MRWSGGRVATFDCSFKHTMRQWLEVSCAHGTVNLDGFVVNQAPVVKAELSKQDIGPLARFFPKEIVKVDSYSGSVQEVKLVEKFSSIVLSGELEEFWPDKTYQTQVVMIALATSAARDGAWVSLKEG